MIRTPPYTLEVIREEEHGRAPRGFLHVRRLFLRNVRPDGTRSAEWVCDFVDRPKGVDAVVVVVWRASGDGDPAGVDVLLRSGLRPATMYGRDPARVPLPDGR